MPRGTAAGQYLAGLTAEEAGKPPTVRVGSHGKTTGNAVIIEQVTVAVAITVGSLSTLTSRLVIPGVSATLIGSMIRLSIGLKNTGQTFAHGTGKASCVAAGQRHAYSFYASTVLPRERALIPVNALNIPDDAGKMPCAIPLGYGNRQIVTWSGLVTVPAASTSRVVHTGPGAYSTIPVSGTPWWVTALAGPLTLTSPTALAWSGTDNGLNQSLVDTTTAHQSYLVNDATGSAAGWHVTASATTFTTGTAALPNSGTFVTTGSTTSITATTAPSPVCSSGATCLLPTNTQAYPVAFTTAATSPTAVTIYDTAALTGLGSIVVGGGAQPVGWWLNVPASAVAGTYTSTVTLQIISGP